MAEQYNDPDSSVASDNVSQTQPRKQLHTGWLVLLFTAAFLFFQWSTVEDVYYRLSGSQPPESKIPWRQDFTAALAESKQVGKPALLVFGATWCPPCKRMKRQVWPDEQVTEAVEAGFVPMYIDVDDPTHAEVVARYQVRGIPTVLVVDSTGEIINKGSTMSRSETLAFLAANNRMQ
jgi:thiol:disulfide interchange protein